MARAPTRDHPSGPQHAHRCSRVLDALDGFLPRPDPPVSQPLPKRGTIAARGTGLQRLPLTPDSPPLHGAALPKGLPVRPGSPLSVAPPKQAKARLIFWFEDNTPPVHARVPIHRGLVRLHENKRILGDINLEMGTKIQRFVRSGKGGSWKDWSWSTAMCMTPPSTIMLRRRGVVQLDQWPPCGEHF
ncbi:hypothetical protein B0H10DRAFT_2071480 [Mycena sp. CBHHK59/15]|nr:hypothetical protein B0H10DRAFT_2071480 [Mycena sp. CBHHK59/15]